MKNLTEIKKKIKTISDISQITNAMQVISVAKLRQYNEHYENSFNYYEKIKGCIAEILLKEDENINHYSFDVREPKHETYIVIASDIGLAADYNTRVLKSALFKINSEDTKKLIIPIGKVANEFFKNTDHEVDSSFVNLLQNHSFDNVLQLTNRLINMFQSQKTDRVTMIYTWGEVANMQVSFRNVFPLRSYYFKMNVKKSKYKNIFDYQPNKSVVIDRVISFYLLNKIYQAILGSIKCENLERMNAMNTATKNADELLALLKINHQKVRQEQITTEIAEISSHKGD